MQSSEYAVVYVHVHEKKHMLASFEDEKSIKYPSPSIQAPLIFQMINDGLTKQALDKC